LCTEWHYSRLHESTNGRGTHCQTQPKNINLLPSGKISVSIYKQQNSARIPTIHNSEQKHKMLAPVFFVSHGSPMNALKKSGKYVDSLRQVANKWKDKINCALVISAHWTTHNGLKMTSKPQPKLMYDFGGFPDELFRFQYQISTSDNLLKRLKEIFGEDVHTDDKRALDHGVWTVLCHMFPNGDVPIVQLSLNYGKPLGQSLRNHYLLGKKLYELRKEGVMIILSGTMVHNLGAISFGDARIPDWAKQFEQLVKKALLANDHETILSLDRGQSARLFQMSHPSIEHFLPLVYLLSVQDIEKDKLSFLQDEYELGSICMLHVLLEDSTHA